MEELTMFDDMIVAAFIALMVVTLILAILFDDKEGKK